MLDWYMTMIQNKLWVLPMCESLQIQLCSLPGPSLGGVSFYFQFSSESTEEQEDVAFVFWPGIVWCRMFFFRRQSENQVRGLVALYDVLVQPLFIDDYHPHTKVQFFLSKCQVLVLVNESELLKSLRCFIFKKKDPFTQNVNTKIQMIRDTNISQ